MSALRVSGRSDYLPLGLLTRAWFHFATGQAEKSGRDLDEAQELAERGSMRLHLADIALCRARFFRNRRALEAARELVETCGYGRRRREVRDLERAFQEHSPAGV